MAQSNVFNCTYPGTKLLNNYTTFKELSLHAYDCHQNVTEPQATENHIKYTHVYIGTVSQAWL